MTIDNYSAPTLASCSSVPPATTTASRPAPLSSLLGRHTGLAPPGAGAGRPIWGENISFKLETGNIFCCLLSESDQRDVVQEEGSAVARVGEDDGGGDLTILQPRPGSLGRAVGRRHHPGGGHEDTRAALPSAGHGG